MQSHKAFVIWEPEPAQRERVQGLGLQGLGFRV